MPQNVYVSDRFPAAWPTPRIENRRIKPVIQAMRFSSLDLPVGTDWSGDFVATTNTASIEVIGTNIFSFSVPQSGIGQFHFQFHIIDVPSFYVRSYLLRVIARNGAGDASEEDLSFRIRGR